MTAATAPRLDDPRAADDAEAAYQQGYTEGRAEGLALRPDADTWVPVPSRWRHAAPGDTFVGQGQLWHVRDLEPAGRFLNVTAYCGHQVANRTVDLDDSITILVGVPERDAVALLRSELGARLIGRTGGDSAPG